MKKTVVFDFDGVIHSYTSGYQGAHTANDPVVPGIAGVIHALRTDGFEVVVSSPRCRTDDGMKAISDYLNKHGIEVDNIVADKPPAICYIDDRAICFRGNTDGLVDQIKSFRSWTQELGG